MTAMPTVLTVAVLGLIAFGWAGTADAQTDGAKRGVSRSDLAAHAQAQPKRARTRIRVTPLYPYRTESLPYPTPYEYEYPGPGFIRQCFAQLVPEYRPSGTVIVPVTHCWWQRGRG
jgi:hypothetical protein